MRASDCNFIYNKNLLLQIDHQLNLDRTFPTRCAFVLCRMMMLFLAGTLSCKVRRYFYNVWSSWWHFLTQYIFHMQDAGFQRKSDCEQETQDWIELTQEAAQVVVMHPSSKAWEILVVYSGDESQILTGDKNTVLYVYLWLARTCKRAIYSRYYISMFISI